MGAPSFLSFEPFIDLAQPRLGAVVLEVSDEFFAAKERLIDPQPPIFVPGKYDEHGKWMDGWETRRRRGQGHDYCIVKLGTAGRISKVNIDTSHFTGNYPPAASIDACLCSGAPGPDTRWETILASRPLTGNSDNWFAVDSSEIWSHLRLNIYPDGGVARLRVLGKPATNWIQYGQDEEVELSALALGASIVACNDMHFGSAFNLLAPGRGVNMGDGWETRRRREPGHDWVIVKLAHPGILEQIEIDTAHFRGNYPDTCSVQAASAQTSDPYSIVTAAQFWNTVLPSQKLSADAVHTFTHLESIGPVSHLRLNIFPDGGVSRLRVWGRLA